MNKIIFTGNITKDCVLRHTPEGNTVCNFAVATNIKRKNKERTEFYECALWGVRAEGKLPQYLKKGQRVLIIGDPQQERRKHMDNEYFSVKVTIDDLELLGGGPRSSVPNGGHTPPPGPAAPDNTGFNDDIPF